MIIFHTVYGHVQHLAEEILIGVNNIPSVKGELWRVPEILPKEILINMNIKELDEDIPVLTCEKLNLMKEADGFLFGTPTRFGLMSGQMKAFWDMTGKFWVEGALVNKPAGLFFSTAAQGGGQETTALTFVTHLAHHGMIYVPLGYSYGKDLTRLDEVRGSSAYGSGTLAGSDNLRKPSDLELSIARYQGENFAKFLINYKQ